MKKPKTLTDLIRLAIEHGWVEHEELVEISKELLDHMGPVKLDEIIREANRQKLERVIPNGIIKILFAGVAEADIREIQIENKLQEFQRLVEGNIEVISLTTDLAMVVNEEGRLNGMANNQFTPKLFKAPIMGSFLIVGVKGDDFINWDEPAGANEFACDMLDW